MSAMEPWRAAWMAFIAVTDPDRELSELADGDDVDPRWRAAWEAAAAAVETEQLRLVRGELDALREVMAGLTTFMHAEADATGDDRIAAALHEYACRIRLALGPDRTREALEQ